MIRKTIFWIHLVSAVATALVILMMSVTGVLLTYQRQMLDWAERDLYAIPEENSVRQPIESIVETVALSEPGFRRSSVIISSNCPAKTTPKSSSPSTWAMADSHSAGTI